MLLFSSVWAGERTNLTTSTGDEKLDDSLRQLNEAARKDLRAFARNLSRYYHIPPETADWLLEQVGLAPADAYMAAKVSKLSKKPIRDVVEEYKKNRGKGWGVIAKNLGIKPGSKEFHELKNDDSGLLEKGKGKEKGKKEKKKGKQKKSK